VAGNRITYLASSNARRDAEPDTPSTIPMKRACIIGKRFDLRFSRAARMEAASLNPDNQVCIRRWIWPLRFNMAYKVGMYEVRMIEGCLRLHLIRKPAERMMAQEEHDVACAYRRISNFNRGVHRILTEHQLAAV
jgi:hypothetical protein